ncbi:MAG: hypothetical protein IKO62_06000 [Bacteroidales bacterium]|nr:hypothetical protein [Bacteroidales bacterium]
MLEMDANENKLVEQENMFYNLPLGKLSTLKELVEDVGSDTDKLAFRIRHAELAMIEALSFDMDTESRYVWKFIVSTMKLYNSLRNEALAACGVVDDNSIEEEGGEL